MNMLKMAKHTRSEGKSINIPTTTAKFMNFALGDIKDTNNTAEVPKLLSSPLRGLEKSIFPTSRNFLGTNIKCIWGSPCF